MCTRVVLRKLIYSKNKIKQVQNHLNYLIENMPTVDPKKLPAKASVWQPDEEVPLFKKFKVFKSYPLKETIKEMFWKHDKIALIFEKESFHCCYEKVKSIL